MVNLPGSPGGCRDGFAVLSRPSGTPCSCSPARRRRTARRDGGAVVYPRRFASLVKLEHTVFALPFAYVGAFLALDEVPSAGEDRLVTLAMVGAARSRWRSTAWWTRASTRAIRARRPRAAAGDAAPGRSLVFCAGSLAVFLLAVFNLDPVVRWLWPIPVAMFVVYPYLKRVTWLSHAWLGATLGLAPVGGWVAMTGELPLAAWLLGGAVAAWVAGFDLLYAIFDIEIDRAQSLHSFPARFGVPAAFWGARVLHVVDRRCCSPGPALELDAGVFYWLGVAVCRGAARVRACDRLAGRPAPPEHGVLHAEQRDQHRVLLLRARGRDRCDPRQRPGQALRRQARLQGVDFELPRGGFFVVTGPNGSGKTTLLRLCAGLAAPTSGELEVTRRSRSDRLSRTRAARLQGADGAREPRPLRASVRDPGATRADRHAARAVRPLGRARGARVDVLARHGAASCALPLAAPRPRAA